MKQKLNSKERQRLQDKKNNDAIAKIVSVFFIIITAFYPLYVGFSKYINLTQEKTFFFWGVTIIIGLILLLTLISMQKISGIDNYYAEDEPARRVSVFEWALLSFIIWAFLSSIISAWLKGYGGIVWLGYRTETTERYEGFISYLCYAINFIIIARFYKPKRLHMSLIAGSAVLISVYGVMQFFGLDIFKLFPYELFPDGSGGSIYGPISVFFRTTLGNVNLVSAYCSFAVVLFAALYAVSRSKWQYLYLSAGIASFALALTTGSSGDAHKVAIAASMVLLVPYWLAERERLGRIFIILSGWCAVYAGHSAYLSAMKKKFELDASVFARSDQIFLRKYADGRIMLYFVFSAILLLAGVFILLVLKKWNKRVFKASGVILLPVVIIGGLIGLEIIGSRLEDNPNNFIWQAREMMHGRFEDDFGSGRGFIWRNGLAVLPDNPVFGTGPDTFFYALGLETQIEATGKFNQTFDKAHNVFLQIAVCMGIPALLAFIIFIGSIFLSAVKKAFDRPLLLAFGGAALSYAIQSFFCVEVPITTPLFWIALGVMASEIWQAKIGCENIEL